MIRPEVAALSRSRLGWVKQNYIRADTLTAANAKLVAAQNDIDLVRAWGSGEVASADGLRFVVPIRTIHSGPNPRYFGRERGVTYYNMTSDQYTGLNGVVVPGTLRDSLVLLSVLLEQETELKPVEIMTDTGAYTDAIFGIFYLLGFQFSPRLADAGGARLWRIDQKADYGPLNRLVSGRINTRIITEQWDDLLRLAGSLKLGVVQASGLIRTLQTNNSPTRLARALAELGRIIKTVHLLNYFDDEAYRRRILVQLNRGEGRHMLSRAVFHGKRGELRQRYRQGQEDQLERTRPDRQRDRTLEHDLHGRGAAAAPQGGLRGQGGGCCPPVAARARAHQHAWPLRLLATRQDRTRRAAATQEPGSARRGGLKEALPSNSVPLLLGPQHEQGPADAWNKGQHIDPTNQSRGMSRGGNERLVKPCEAPATCTPAAAVRIRPTQSRPTPSRRCARRQAAHRCSQRSLIAAPLCRLRPGSGSLRQTGIAAFPKSPASARQPSSSGQDRPRRNVSRRSGSERAAEGF